MKRTYSNGEHTNVNFFTGIEIEKTPAYGKSTLFVVGVQTLKDIHDRISYYSAAGTLQRVEHIYLGANQSFVPAIPWDRMIRKVLTLGMLTTLDFDVKHIDWVIDRSYSENNLFIPQISVKIPYIRQLNYNATIKIDDKDFNASNPGVWCHRLHDLQSYDSFTDWSKYGKDTPL